MAEDLYRSLYRSAIVCKDKEIIRKGWPISEKLNGLVAAVKHWSKREGSATPWPILVVPAEGVDRSDNGLPRRWNVAAQSYDRWDRHDGFVRRRPDGRWERWVGSEAAYHPAGRAYPERDRRPRDEHSGWHFPMARRGRPLLLRWRHGRYVEAETLPYVEPVLLIVDPQIFRKRQGRTVQDPPYQIWQQSEFFPHGGTHYGSSEYHDVDWRDPKQIADHWTFRVIGTDLGSFFADGNLVTVLFPRVTIPRRIVKHRTIRNVPTVETTDVLYVSLHVYSEAISLGSVPGREYWPDRVATFAVRMDGVPYKTAKEKAPTPFVFLKKWNGSDEPMGR
jgi:hypothetical protein